MENYTHGDITQMDRYGDNTTIDKHFPTLVNAINGVVSIKAGLAHTVALTETGEVYAWGYNYYGQLSGSEGRIEPYKVGGISGIVQIEAGMFHTVALRENGEVYAWGESGYSQLGDGKVAGSNIPVTVVSKTGGNLTNISKIYVGGRTNFAVNDNGEIYAWGYNANGQLGDGTTTDKPSAVKVWNGIEVEDIFIGEYHTIVLTKDGRVLSTGHNGNGRLGNESYTDSASLVNVIDSDKKPLTAIKYLGKGSKAQSSYAIDELGRIYSWGRNEVGQLGHGTTRDETIASLVDTDILQVKDRPFSVKEGVEKQLEVELIRGLNVLNRDNITLNLTYESTDTEVFTVNENGVITGKKPGSAKVKIMDSTTGLKTMTEIIVLQNTEDAIAKPMIGSGVNFSAVLKQDGTVWTAGYNDCGQLGDGSIIERIEFAQVKVNANEYLTGIIQIAVRKKPCDGVKKGWNSIRMGI